MAITLRQLSYFLALVEEGGFGAAAARVHVSQPALSMQIRNLEAELAVRLVERLPRGILLTRAGRDLAERARKVLAEVNGLEVATRRHGQRRRVNLGMIPTVAPYLLPRVLTGLRRADPDRELRVREAQTAVLIEALQSGQLDAVVVASPPVAQDLVGQVLFQDRFVLAGQAAHLAALGPARDALRPAALDPDKLLLLDEGHCLADQALEVCALDRRHVRLDLGASSLATLCGLVAQGLGLTFLPEIAIATECAAQPDLALMRFSAPEPERSILLVRRSASGEDHGFAEMAEELVRAGTALVAEARAAHPAR